MKKTLLLFCLFGAYQAHSQVTFNPGVRAGVNFSTLSHVDGTTKTDFYVGVLGAIKFTPFYTLQPELNYSRQGAKDAIHQYETAYLPPVGGDWSGQQGQPELRKDLPLQYLGVNVINKFEFKKFNFHAGPGLEFLVNAPSNTNSDVDVTINLGIGYDFTESLGIEARFKKGFAEPYSDYSDYFFFSDNPITNTTFQIGLYYKIK